jgi:hypothetical protein
LVSNILVGCTVACCQGDNHAGAKSSHERISASPAQRTLGLVCRADRACEDETDILVGAQVAARQAPACCLSSECGSSDAAPPEFSNGILEHHLHHVANHDAIKLAGDLLQLPPARLGRRGTRRSRVGQARRRRGPIWLTLPRPRLGTLFGHSARRDDGARGEKDERARLSVSLRGLPLWTLPEKAFCRQ